VAFPRVALRGQCPAEWWALRFILGVYSPLSIAAMPPVSLVGSSWANRPLGQVCIFSTRRTRLGQCGRGGVSDRVGLAPAGTATTRPYTVRANSRATSRPFLPARALIAWSELLDLRRKGVERKAAATCVG
jgi:hypothetical protein